ERQRHHADQDESEQREHHERLPLFTPHSQVAVVHRRWGLLSVLRASYSRGNSGLFENYRTPLTTWDIGPTFQGTREILLSTRETNGLLARCAGMLNRRPDRAGAVFALTVSFWMGRQVSYESQSKGGRHGPTYRAPGARARRILAGDSAWAIRRLQRHASGGAAHAGAHRAGADSRRASRACHAVARRR